MSNLVFPSSLAGLGIDVQRQPFYQVDTQVAESGKEYRTTPGWTYPRYRFQVKFDILRSDAAIATRTRELQQLLGHLARSFGQLDSFLFTDPTDSGVIDHGFAAGDGVAAAFQLQRSLAGDIIDAAGFGYRAQTKPYTNKFWNSSFETDSNADGIADSWGIYNNETAINPILASIVPGRNGGKAQRVSWGTNATEAKGINQNGGPAALWVAGQWQTVGVFARATGSNVGKFLTIRHNSPGPDQQLHISNPPLSTAWQLYVFQLLWNLGLTPLSQFHLTICLNADGSGFSGTFGDLDFDDLISVAGQYTATTLPQSLATPAAAAATRTPSYWPNYADGFEPIFDLNGDSTIYEDGTWRGRRTLYPWARTNLVPFSEQQDNAAWTKNNFTVTANTTTAPDGTATADKLVENAVATVEHYSEQAFAAAAGSLAALTAYVKPAGRSWLDLLIVKRDAATVVGAFFDVTNGVIGTVDAGVSAFMEYAGNGWYRCEIVVNVGIGGSNPRIRIKDSTGNGVTTHTGDGASGLFVWGADGKIVSSTASSAITSYIPTPSSTAVTVTDYTLSAAGVFTPATVPGVGTFFSWDGSYYRRVRFDEDLSVDQIVQAMWAAKSVRLVSVK